MSENGQQSPGFHLDPDHPESKPILDGVDKILEMNVNLGDHLMILTGALVTITRTVANDKNIPIAYRLAIVTLATISENLYKKVCQFDHVMSPERYKPSTREDFDKQERERVQEEVDILKQGLDEFVLGGSDQSPKGEKKPEEAAQGVEMDIPGNCPPELREKILKMAKEVGASSVSIVEMSVDSSEEGS